LISNGFEGEPSRTSNPEDALHLLP
jgi:hypothetical protein